VAVDAENDTIRVQLLADIRAVLNGSDFKGSDRISSEDLTTRLVALEERPWSECSRGKPLTKTKLARLLRPFGVVSGSKRLPDGTTPKGYLLDQFADAFRRYLPQDTPSHGNPVLIRHTATSKAGRGFPRILKAQQRVGVAFLKMAQNLAVMRVVAVWRFQIPLLGREMVQTARLVGYEHPTRQAFDARRDPKRPRGGW
jgi:hypothetical protein